MNREGVVVQQQPGGLYTATGGTRTQVKLSRPWQKEMVPNPSTCPFETREQKVIAEYEVGNGWRVLDNISTPFPMHRLIIPKQCWESEKLYRLGGREEFANALRIATGQVDEQNTHKVLLSAHIGWLAGQNLPHFHIHDLDTRFYPPDSRAPIGGETGETTENQILRYVANNRSCRIIENPLYVVTAGGHRAGQCFITPEAMSHPLNNWEKALAKQFLEVIDLYAERFRSTEKGLAPHYMIGLKILDGRFRYGFYIPILNHWGATEYFGLMGEEPLILPWPHEETARHLKG